MNQRIALPSAAGLFTRPPPSVVHGRLRSQAQSSEQAIAQISSDVSSWKQRGEARLSALEASLDDANALRDAGRIGAGAAGAVVDKAYTDIFTSFVRRGSEPEELKTQNSTGSRQMIKAAMSEGVDSGGGYVAPVEWDRKIIQKQRIFSPMRRLATVMQTSVRGFSTVWSDGAWGSGWVGETAARPQTTTPILSSLSFSAGQLYAMPSITQDLLDDAEFNAADWLQNEMAETFSLNEGIAFAGGDGVNKPRGFLTYVTGGANDGVHPGGNLTVRPSGTAGGLGAGVTATDMLVDFVYSLSSVYRVGASWLMNSVTAATIAKLKDGQGNYVWSKALTVGQPSTLLGYPVEIDENMPDAAAGNLAIAFGDFRRGYVINDRMGITALRDPFTSKPYVLFYCRKRVGGGVWDPNAIRLLKIAAS